MSTLCYTWTSLHTDQESTKALTNTFVWPIWLVSPKKLTGGMLFETIWLGHGPLDLATNRASTTFFRSFFRMHPSYRSNHVLVTAFGLSWFACNILDRISKIVAVDVGRQYCQYVAAVDAVSPEDVLYCPVTWHAALRSHRSLRRTSIYRWSDHWLSRLPRQRSHCRCIYNSLNSGCLFCIANSTLFCLGDSTLGQ